MSTVDRLRAAALEQLEQMRPACEARKGVMPVHEAMVHCVNNALLPPPWLAALFVAPVVRVREAVVGSLDAAFGAPYPRRTRLSQVRQDLELQRRVHAAVYALVEADPAIVVNAKLFKKVGAMPGIHVSARTASRRYYEALRRGAWNPVLLRSASCQLS